MKKSGRVFIIAEAGVNHNGSLDLAKRLVDEAKKAGADAVKFQTFKSSRLASKAAPKAGYQKTGPTADQSQQTMLKQLELSARDHVEIMSHCRSIGIAFVSSPFDIPSIKLLARLGLSQFKIPSGEITNLPYLREIGALGKSIILSTGMANLGEIENALEILTNAGTKRQNIVILHCTTEYPSPYREVNLSAMVTIREAFDVNVGYSDHTLGIEVAVAAVALGATIIEKHFTLGRTMDGPDHMASLEPGEMKQLVRAVRHIEAALGDGIKRPTRSEIKNLIPVRKSIVAAKDIKKGARYTVANITTKRPGNGLSPMLWDAVLGRRAGKDYAEDDLI